jgi:nickel-dependent lactate racemase
VAGAAVLVAPAPSGEPLQDPAELAAAAVAALAPGAGDSLLLVVPDRTRAVPLARLLAALWPELDRAGVAPERITLAVAAGTHRSDRLDIAAARLGPLPPRLRVHVHDADGPCVDLGLTPAGTPVRVDRVLVDADRVLSLGGIAFHYFAGFGGGWKAFFPGLAERAAVAANHRRSLGPWPPGGLAPGVGPGRIAGNPVAEDLRDVARLLPPAVVWTTWDEGTRGAVDARVEDYAATCARYAAPRRVGAPASASLVVASAGGWPRDVDVVQSHKALLHAARYTAPGGRIVFHAGCREGAGSAAMERWLARADRGDLEAAARAAYDLNAQTAISLAAIGAAHDVTWFAERPLPELARWGFDVRPGDPGDARALGEAEAERAGLAPLVLPRAADVLPQEPAASTSGLPSA